jgi:hypothetical protein
MIGLAPKPQDVYDNKKKQQIGNWMKNHEYLLKVNDPRKKYFVMK